MSRRLVRQEVIEQATALFADKGYEQTTLKDISERVGLSRPALYHYVASKEEILASLSERGLEFAAALSALRANTDLTATQKLDQLTRILARQRAEAPETFRVLDKSERLLPEPEQSRHRHARHTILNDLTAIIETGISTGEFRDMNARTAALSVLGVCNWIAWWFNASRDDLDAVVAEVTSSVLAMLAGPEAARAALSPADAIKQAREALNDLEARFVRDAP